MPKQKQGESFHRFAIRVAWELGHFWSPSNPEGKTLSQSDLASLTVNDDVVVKALISLSKSSVGPDGKIHEFQGPTSPEMQAILEESRCPVPDFAPPPGVVFAFDDPDLQQIALKMQRDAQEAIGTGNWPGCNNVGNFHCAAIGIDDSGLPSFLKPLFTQVLTNVRKAYAGVGLLLKFIQNGKDVLVGTPFSGQINSDMSFVPSSSGWIGLAIVGQNESCSSKIWCKFLSTYKGGSTDAAIIQQWTTLIKHELGHNCGRSHTSGGVMNPSIVNGLPTEWGPEDPSTSWLKGQFGGVPVTIPGDSPTPPGPIPPSTLEQRVHALEVQNAVNKVTLDWCVTKIHELGG